MACAAAAGQLGRGGGGGWQRVGRRGWVAEGGGQRAAWGAPRAAGEGTAGWVAACVASVRGARRAARQRAAWRALEGSAPPGPRVQRVGKQLRTRLPGVGRVGTLVGTRRDARWALGVAGMAGLRWVYVGSWVRYTFFAFSPQRLAQSHCQLRGGIAGLENTTMPLRNR
jgi:hypothetical protein